MQEWKVSDIQAGIYHFISGLETVKVNVSAFYLGTTGKHFFVLRYVISRPPIGLVKNVVDAVECEGNFAGIVKAGKIRSGQTGTVSDQKASASRAAAAQRCEPSSAGCAVVMCQLIWLDQPCTDGLDGVHIIPLGISICEEKYRVGSSLEWFVCIQRSFSHHKGDTVHR